MSEKIERFFHIRPHAFQSILRQGEWVWANVPVSRGGATVRILSDGETASVQVAFCSSQDAFCRATGRETAMRHPMKVLPLEQVPMELGNVSRQVASRILKLSRTKRKEHDLWNVDYSFAVRKLTPKVAATQE